MGGNRAIFVSSTSAPKIGLTECRDSFFISKLMEEVDHSINSLSHFSSIVKLLITEVQRRGRGLSMMSFLVRLASFISDVFTI